MRPARCIWHWRHWFTYYGQPGTSSPVCRRCAAPNPDYRPEDDPERPTEWCNCQAIPGTANYPGPWHPHGDSTCSHWSAVHPELRGT
jgi:hypothetical protein